MVKSRNPFSDSMDHAGYIAWLHQTDPDFDLFSSANQTELDMDWRIRKNSVDKLLSDSQTRNQKVRFKDKGKSSVTTQWRKIQTQQLPLLSSSVPVIDLQSHVTTATEKIDLLVLRRYSALRYCNEAQEMRHDWIERLRVKETTPGLLDDVAVLHCFVEAGPLGEQGKKKKDLKVNVMHALNIWVLKESWWTKDVVYTTNISLGFSILDRAHSHRIADQLADDQHVAQLKKVWLEGNWSAAINWLNVTKTGKRGKKKKRPKSLLIHENATAILRKKSSKSSRKGSTNRLEGDNVPTSIIRH